MPTDDLMPECIDYLKTLGSRSTKLSEILNNHDDIVYKALDIGNSYFCVYISKRRLLEKVRYI